MKINPVFIEKKLFSISYKCSENINIIRYINTRITVNALHCSKKATYATYFA